MSKIISALVLGVLMSAYFYPFSLSFLPASLNMKKLLAVIGVVIFVLQSVRIKSLSIHKDVITPTLMACFFSLACYLSISLNNTNDMAYCSYIATYLVWLFGAYAVYSFFKLRYKTVDIKIIAKYLAWVAVAQCILAQLIDTYPAFQSFVDSYFLQGADFYRRVHRLYGIGAFLDPAGVRFALTLLLLAYVIEDARKDLTKRKEYFWSIIAFIVITVLGNMISRTTTVGTILGLAYLAYYLIQDIKVDIPVYAVRAFGVALVLIVITVLVSTYFYHSNSRMYSYFRFAFEGFFNWAETGVWSTGSTDKLNANMWVWPKDVGSWIFGYGLFDGWIYGTDIGYCRFIMYCGLFGFLIFSLFFVANAIVCARKNKGTGFLFLLMLTLSFIVWIKVSTDIFQIYALLLCADKLKTAKE